MPPQSPPPQSPPPQSPPPAYDPTTPLPMPVEAQVPASVGASPEPTKKSRAGLYVAIAVVLVVVGAGAAILAAGGGEESASSTTDAGPTTVAPTETSTTSTATNDSTQDSTATPPPGADATVAELARSTVQVMLLAGGQPTCTGSGTFIGADGTILTNAHVVDPAGGCSYDTIGIAITDDAGLPPVLLYEAQIYAYDAVLDLAVLRVVSDLDGNGVTTTFPAVAVGDSDLVQIGDQLRILGYPGIGGDTVTFTNGVVSGFTSQNNVGDRSWIKTDATIAGGNSGGAAFGAEGKLIGVPTQAAASDSGPIVDCRVITDTNGDGLFNDEDQCVPIGGFLNGIRPVNLAAPLIEEAKTAAAIDLDQTPTADPPGSSDLSSVFISNPGWSLEASDDVGFEPEFVVTTAAGSTSLCIWFDWEGIPDGVVWDGVWLIDGEPEDSYSFFGESWDLGSEGVDNWVCALDENGLVPGVYEFAFFLDEEVQFFESIRVTPSPVPTYEVTFLNSSGADVCYLFVAPLGASDTGLDELAFDEILASGQQTVLLVPEGGIITDAYGCELNVLLENYDGILISGDQTIEISG